MTRALLAEPRDTADTPTTFRLYHEVAEAWEAVADDLAAAQRSIDFEQYIVGDDAIGRRILGIMAERARAGVRVRVLLDWFGSLALKDSDAARDLHEAGGTVRFYNPLTARAVLMAPTRIHRDHRKTILIDGETAWAGGICFTDRMCDWRDTFMRVGGTVPIPMAEMFDLSWRRAEHPTAKRRMTREEAERDVYHRQDGPFRYMVNSPEKPIRRDLFRCVLKRIDGATHTLRLTTPYFVPEHRLLRHLTAAARRGVDVTLLLPEVSDHPPLDILGRAFAERLVRAGCTVQFFRHRMMHAKVAIVDDAWACVSSHNLDRLSSRLNLENGVTSEAPSFIAALNDQFDRDLENSITEPPALESWKPMLDPLLRLFGRVF
ncbi:Cardiolipin synthetase [Caenispirillum salinarum AK4]|uniref:Phospholipase D n=1 Tax=Caenispirillum salinarum AK4 TaxID=1238182 RepID=K9GWV9_9PROT|nr:phosphatidylserine/phosphatidylglycerophosphate/cardiolipin synthase family protein [Caenispirillum salinarum]EKV29234.1 Cardiolipin synthetase [Caenispirillum salinarum AK4]